MISTECSNELITAWLGGEIDHHTAREMREKIDAEIEQWRPSLLILDFRDVTFMDSSGIGLIMGRYRMMTAGGGTLRVENAPPRVEQMMQMAGLHRLPIWNERKDVL